MISFKACANLLKIPYKGPDIFFSSISVDTRTLKPGALFIAIQGTHFDGHDFIELAYKKKAAAVITQRSITAEIPFLKVLDTKKALGMVAQYHRKRFDLPIIALTGSCGKTTTKEYLKNIFDECGCTLASEKSFNNEIGVPLTLLKLTSSHRFAILEMGANAVGEIAWLTSLAQPSIAIILNIGTAHLEGFGSLDNIAKAKIEIFQGLSPTGIGIVHTNVMKLWEKFLPKNKEIILYGTQEKSLLSVQSISLDRQGRAKFMLSANTGKKVSIQLPLLGLHQVENALAAATAAVSLGVCLDTIKKGLEATKPISGRLEMHVSYHGAEILDDTYNASPDSVKASLQVLKYYPTKKILVLGDLAELGDDGQALLASIGHHARELGIDQLFTCGIISEFASKAFGKNAHHFRDMQLLIEALDRQLNEHCTVLVKGSRSAKMERVVQAFLK